MQKNFRIVIFQDSVFYPHIRAGSEISLVTLAATLAKRGHKVTCYSRLPDNLRRRTGRFFANLSRTYSHIPIELFSRKFTAGGLDHINLPTFKGRFINRTIRTQRPDFVFFNDNSGGGTETIIKNSLMEGVIVVAFSRSAFLKLPMLRPRPGFHVIANSNWQKERNEAEGVTVDMVIYPTVNFAAYSPGGTNSSERNFVTFVNPVPKKGAEVFCRIVKAMPHRKFLVVLGTWRGTHGSDEFLAANGVTTLPNVTIVPPQDDMSAIYAQTALMLVPSHFEEPFGRVVIEAQASGIPVVASDAGGLSEAVGKGGILVKDRENHAGFTAAIDSIMSDGAYADFSRLARENAARTEFQPDFQASQLEELLHKLKVSRPSRETASIPHQPERE